MKPVGYLPKIGSQSLSQEVCFKELIGPGKGVWTSSSVLLLNNNWSFRFVRNDDSVDFRVKFEGPQEEIELLKVRILIGVGEGDYEGKNYLEDVIKGVSFKALEARLVRNLCTLEQFEGLLEEHYLSFRVELSQVSTGMVPAIPTDLKFDAEPQKKIDDLEGEVARLTRERNKLGMSLHAKSLTDNRVSFLNEGQATQPEVARQYEAFKQKSRSLMFQLLAGRDPAAFGDLVSKFVQRIVRRVGKKRSDKVDGLMQVMGIDLQDEAGRKVAESAYRQIIRQTGHTSLTTVNPQEMEELVQIIKSSELGELENEQECSDFGSFIWSLVEYLQCSDSLYVNWDAFGTLVSFDRSKYKSISRRVRAGEECILILPMLQRLPFEGSGRREPEDYECLCMGFICPT